MPCSFDYECLVNEVAVAAADAMERTFPSFHCDKSEVMLAQFDFVSDSSRFHYSFHDASCELVGSESLDCDMGRLASCNQQLVVLTTVDVGNCYAAMELDSLQS